MTFSAIHFCQVEPTSKVIISSDVFRCNTEKGDRDGEEEEEEEPASPLVTKEKPPGWVCVKVTPCVKMVV